MINRTPKTSGKLSHRLSPYKHGKVRVKTTIIYLLLFLLIYELAAISAFKLSLFGDQPLFVYVMLIHSMPIAVIFVLGIRKVQTLAYNATKLNKTLLYIATSFVMMVVFAATLFIVGQEFYLAPLLLGWLTFYGVLTYIDSNYKIEGQLCIDSEIIRSHSSIHTSPFINDGSFSLTRESAEELIKQTATLVNYHARPRDKVITISSHLVTTRYIERLATELKIRNEWQVSSIEQSSWLKSHFSVLISSVFFNKSLRYRQGNVVKLTRTPEAEPEASKQ